jgi:drug/metabolite transporter (DMT)-like permease
MNQPGPAPAPTGRNLAGAGLMVVATLFFAGMHAVVRHLAAEGIHPFEIAFFRNFFGIFVVVPWLARYGLAPLRTARFDLHVWRAVINVTSMLAFFYALSIAPLAQMTALSFTAPIFATVLAMIVFKELVGIRRWTAILIGFVGTLVVVRPGIGEIGLGPPLAVFATVGWAACLIMIKIMARTDASITITTYMSLLMAPVSLVPALFFWQWPNGEQLAWMAYVGIGGGIGQLLMTQALKIADTNVVMPIDFLKLPWVAAIAFFAFGEVPDVFTWIGGAMVFGCAAYIAYRERARGRANRALGRDRSRPASDPPAQG